MSLLETPRDVAGIRISKEVSVTTAPDTAMMQMHDVSHTKVESGSHAQQFGPRLRKLSNSSSIISDIFKHPDLSEDRLKRRIKEADARPSPKDLIDFLRNTTPPPGNYMSVPDKFDSSSSSSDERGPWRPIMRALRLRPKKKKKKAKAKQARAKKRTIEIQLPDSAVAGRTIGGHRHIAISIPVEHAYTDTDTDLTPRRKLTEEENEEFIRTGTVPAKTVETRSGVVRLNSDRGVVTVLKPVVESRESIDNMLQRSAMLGDERLKASRPRPHSAHAATILAVAPRAGNDRRAVDNVPDITFTRGDDVVRPRTADATTVSSHGGSDHAVVGLHPPQHGPKGSISSFTSIGGAGSQSSGGRLSFPTRRSSLGHTTYAHHRSYSHSSVEHGGSSARESADSLMVRRHRRGLSSIDSNFGTRASIADSIATDGTEPVIVDASTARAYGVPAVVALEGSSRSGTDPAAAASNRVSMVTDLETVVNVSMQDEEAHDEKRLSIASMPEIRSPTEYLAGFQRRSQDDGRRGSGERAFTNHLPESLNIPERRRSKRQKDLDLQDETKALRIDILRPGIPVRSNSTRSGAETLVNQPATGQSLSMAPVLTVADTKPFVPVLSPAGTADSRSTSSLATVVKDEAFVTPPSTIISPAFLSAAHSPRRSNSARESRIRLPIAPEPRTSSLRPHSHTRMAASAVRREPLSPLSPTSLSPSSPQTMITAASKPLDRVSLSRRRERRERAMERELRQDRDRVAREEEAFRLRNELIQREEQILARSSSHADLMKRYEDLRDVREHELETRLAQLERNSEAWLKLFDRLNHTLQSRAHGVGKTYGLGWRQQSWEELKMQELLQDYRTQQEREREHFRAQRERRRLDRIRVEDGLEERAREYRRELAEPTDAVGDRGRQLDSNTSPYELAGRRFYLDGTRSPSANRLPAAHAPNDTGGHRGRSWKQDLRAKDEGDRYELSPISATPARPTHTLLRPFTMAGLDLRPTSSAGATSTPRSRTLHGYAQGPAYAQGQDRAKSPLQEEFEAELARRRGLEELAAVIDARMIASPTVAPAGGWRSAFADFDDGLSEACASGARSARGSVDLGGYVDDSARDRAGVANVNVSGLDTLEPLMRELMGAARMDNKDGGVEMRGGEMDENESVLSAEAEYLFEEF